jgi:multiple sugar transport system ATP-binding protein
MNFLPASLEGRPLRLFGARVPLPADLVAPPGELPLVAGIRPEHLEDALAGPAAPGSVELEAEVGAVEWLGNEQYAYLPLQATPARDRLSELARRLDVDASRELVASLDPESRLRPGTRARFRLDPARIHLFDGETGRRIEPARRLPP